MLTKMSKTHITKYIKPINSIIKYKNISYYVGEKVSNYHPPQFNDDRVNYYSINDGYSSEIINDMRSNISTLENKINELESQIKNNTSLEKEISQLKQEINNLHNSNTTMKNNYHRLSEIVYGLGLFTIGSLIITIANRK
jgi:hypothetical protein